MFSDAVHNEGIILEAGVPSNDVMPDEPAKEGGCDGDYAFLPMHILAMCVILKDL